MTRKFKSSTISPLRPARPTHPPTPPAASSAAPSPKNQSPPLDVCARAFTSFNCPISSCALSIRAFALVARAFGPRRSQSDLDLHPVLQRILQLRLRLQVLLLALQKLRVAPLHPQQPIRIHPVQLHYLGRHILQKIPIMAHQHARKPALLQQLLQPRNPRQVQMVRRLVQQQHIRPASPSPPQSPAASASLRSASPPPPSSRGNPTRPPVSRSRPSCSASGTPARSSAASSTSRTVSPGRKVRLLPHIPDPRPLPHRHLARIRLLLPRQHLQQRRLPRAIRPDQPNPVPIRNRKRNLLKQRHSAKALRHALCIQNRWHSSSLPSSTHARGSALRITRKNIKQRRIVEREPEDMLSLSLNH